ncbi:MAG: acetate--CoA ligase family protein [Comamonadaceae bacterium]|nr:acetate--CoA ligase family protein [Comamonadaceae bacterium]
MPLINGVAVEPMIVKPNGRELMVGVMRDEVFGPADHASARAAPTSRCIGDRARRAAAAQQLPGARHDRLARAWRSLLGEFRNMPPVEHGRPGSWCCCASRRWSASCPGCARWTSTR